jgi:hypothetical protein
VLQGSQPAPLPSAAIGAPAPAAAISAPIVPPHLLALPFGVIDADLSAMPDRYVNEPLPASFRRVISVRGRAAVASVDPPSAIIWTEDGLHYSLTSSARSTAQLIELADRLR